ncbi:MAG: pilin [Patescibacteria group bacterium]
MLKNKKQFKILLTGLLVVFVLVGFGVLVLGDDALAAENVLCADCKKQDKSNICLQVSIPGIGNCVKGFPQYVKGIYNFFIGIVGLLAVIMIMAGGFQWLLAAGNAQKITGAKTTIMSAIMGLVLALGSYTVLSWINPEILTLKLPSLVITSTGKAENFCPKDNNIDYIKVAGQSFNEIPDDKFDTTGANTKCGDTYYIKKRGGDTCSGKKCDGDGYRCFNEICAKGDWFGSIACGSDDNKCVDQIDINVLCSDKATGKNYKFEKNVATVGRVDTNERAIEYKIEKLTLFGLFDANNEDRTNQLYCGDTNYKPTWIFMSVEAKSGGADDWRGLASSGKDNVWSGSSALAGCFDIKPSEFSNDNWVRAVGANQLMPLDILKEDNLPIYYDINLPSIEAFDAKCGNCKKCN